MEEGFYSYEVTFKPLGEKIISTYLKERKEKGLKSFVLDIASGDGEAIREMAKAGILTAGLAVGLSDIRFLSTKARDKELGVEVMEADVFKGSTWRKIKEWIKGRDPSGFDLIVCRPICAFPATTSINLYHLIFRRIWKLMKPNTGLFLSETPPNISGKDIQTYLDILKNTWGIESEFIESREVMVVRRKSEEPLELP